MPILDSQGKPVSIVSSSVRNIFEHRGPSLSGGTAPGNTMLSKFAGAGSDDLKKFKRLAADVESANPAIRSPLLNQSNFYMPESDASTGEPNRLLNQWISYYYKWHGLIGNLVNLHSELPLSRFALRGIDDPEILNFYEDMVESAEMHLKMVELLRQYFMFGEAIPFAFWSDQYNCFTDLTFLDGNYVYVKGHYLLHSEEGDDVEFYELEPDPLLINLVKSDDYVNTLLRGYLDENFVAAVNQNKRLLLSNFSTYMIRHRAKWSDLRGTSMVLRCLKSLLYSDKLREAQYCHTPDTEVLTSRGFVPIADVTQSDLVATVNVDDDFSVEYCAPIDTPSFDYDGDMYNFTTYRLDTCVTPNHRMLVKGNTGGWKFVKADKVKKTQKFRASVNWAGKDNIENVEVCGSELSIKDFLEFGGYYVSEGWASHSKTNRGYVVGICQMKKSKHFSKFSSCVGNLPFGFSYSGNNWYTYGKELYYYIKETFGKGSRGKKIPVWIKGLSPRLLQIFIDAAVRGDGTIKKSKNGFKNVCYSTISKRLADDIMEMVLKCGYAVHLRTWKSTTNGNTITMYSVCWSLRKTEHYVLSTQEGRHLSDTHNGKHVQIKKYKGKVHCLTVPNGVFITRRNGRVGIHGNSIADGNVNPKWIWKIGQAGDLATGGYMPSEEDLAAFRDLLIEANNDPIFTIITHYAVNVDAVGLNGKLLPLKQEYDQIENDIMVAMFSNKAVTTGVGPNFATASVAFRAMMSRYIPIRARVERYLYQKIFAPVAYANKFYKRKKCDIAHNVRTGDEDSNQLIIPTIDWRSKSNLLDDGSIKSIVSSMVASGKMPMKILCEALDLDYSEVRNYLYSEQGTVFDNVTQESRKAIAGQNTDSTMMGQPFAPKTNQAVSTKSQTGSTAEPTAKAASREKKAKQLLSIKPLFETPKDPIQTQIDKGKPEKGGNPEPVDPMEESLKLGTAKKEADSKPLLPKSRIFDVSTVTANNKYVAESVIKKKYNERIIANKDALIDKKAEKGEVKEKPAEGSDA